MAVKQQQINIQSVWTSPNGKIKVVTTPEQIKFRIYKLPLLQYFETGSIGTTITVLTQEGFNSKKNESYTEIVNVVIDGKPVLQEQSKPDTQEGKQQVSKQVATPITKDTREQSIERQVSLKSAVELAIADKIKVTDIISRATIFSLWLSGDIKSEQVEDKPIKIEEPTFEEELEIISEMTKREVKIITWSDVQPVIKALFDAKVAGWATVDTIVKKLVNLGADKSSKDVKTAFNSLPDEAKQKFAELVKKEGG